MRRDEVSRLEAAVRNANPVPNVDNVIDSEEAIAVTLLVEQRRRFMTATPTQTAPHPGPPPHRRRSMAWAFAAGFVVILLVVGAAAALFLRGDETPVADDPAPEPTVTTPEVATTAATDDRELATVVDGWQRIGDSWLESEPGSMEPLPGGGFVAAAESDHPEGSRVMWSPDGLNWFDGDPQRLLPHQGLGMAVVGDQVTILAGEDDAPTLWIGNPKTGNWEPMMDLDTSGLEGQLDPWTIEISPGTDAILATAVTPTELPESGVVERSIVVWLVDPEEGAANRTILLVDTPAAELSGPTVWFDGRWHVMLPLVLVDYYWTETALWSSPDGTTWIEDALPEGWHPPMMNFVTAGSAGVVTCATHHGDEDTAGTWFSPNGVDWQLIADGFFCRGVYSDDLGFVLEREGSGFYRLSPDGTTLDWWEAPFPADTGAASGSNLIVHAYRGSEFSESESRGLKGLWLYHEPPDG